VLNNNDDTIAMIRSVILGSKALHK
jgi:hypothetical protein